MQRSINPHVPIPTQKRIVPMKTWSELLISPPHQTVPLTRASRRNPERVRPYDQTTAGPTQSSSQARSSRGSCRLLIRTGKCDLERKRGKARASPERAAPQRASRAAAVRGVPDSSPTPPKGEHHQPREAAALEEQRGGRIRPRPEGRQAPSHRSFSSVPVRVVIAGALLLFLQHQDAAACE